MSDLYKDLCACLYTKRRRTISFKDWYAAMMLQPHDLFLDAQRVVIELFPVAFQCACATVDAKRYSFINYYMQHHVQSLTFFTSLQPPEIKRYLNILMSRHIVRDLVKHQNTTKNPRMLQGLIEQLGGEDYCTWHDNHRMCELHAFFLHVLWQNRVCPSSTLFICVNETDRTALSVTLESVGSHPEFFRCVRMHDNGDVCAKEATMRCERCCRAFYCSSQCKKADATMHQLECMRKCKLCKHKRTVHTVL